MPEFMIHIICIILKDELSAFIVFLLGLYDTNLGLPIWIFALITVILFIDTYNTCVMWRRVNKSRSNVKREHGLCF